MATYVDFFKYINFFFIYVISFVLMFIKRFEMIGIGLSIATSILSNLFLFLDILFSPKNNDVVVIVIILGMASLFISNVFVLNVFVKLHKEYSKKKRPIEYSKKMDKTVKLYKQLFIWNTVLIWITAFLYFSRPKQNDATYFPYYYLSKNPLDIFIFVFKLLSSVSIVGISGYMMYISQQFSNTRTSNLITEKTKNDEEKSTNSVIPYYFTNINYWFNMRPFIKN